MNRDILVMGTAAGLILQPDAIEDFDSAQSAESDVVFALQSKAYSPLGPDGEIVWRRIYVSGWARGEVALYVTPIIDGRPLTDLKTYHRKAAPERGREEKFSFITPLGRIHPDYGGYASGVIGATAQVHIEFKDPRMAFHIETASIYHEPISLARNRGADE